MMVKLSRKLSLHQKIVSLSISSLCRSCQVFSPKCLGPAWIRYNKTSPSHQKKTWLSYLLRGILAVNMVENSNPLNREGHIINILQQSTNDFCHVSRNLPNPQWDHKHWVRANSSFNQSWVAIRRHSPGLEAGVACQPPPRQNILLMEEILHHLRCI